MAFTIPHASWRRPVFRVPFWILAVLACAAILSGLSITSSLTARPDARHRGLATPLELYWLLPTQFSALPGLMWVLDIGGVIGGALFFSLCLKELQRSKPFMRLKPEKVFLAGTGLALLLIHLVYQQLNDTYIISLIPFALLVFGEFLKNVRLSKLMMSQSTVIAGVVILGVAMWMRGGYARQQAIWSSADNLMRSGVQPSNVAAPYWAEYHGLFDEWVAAGTPGYTLRDHRRYLHPPQDPYNIWRQSQWDRVPYRIADSSDPTAPQGWKVIASRSYRSAG